MSKGCKFSSKDRLIDSAKYLMWKKSYHQVSVEMICKHANVQKGSFYHYFSSKSDLGIAALEDHYEEFRPKLDEVFSASISPKERYFRFIELVYDVQKNMSDNCGRVCGVLPVTVGVEISRQDQKIRETIQDIMKRYEMYHQSALRDMVAEGIVAKDINVEIVAARIHNFIIGCLVMARIHNSLSSLKAEMKSGILDIMNISA